VPRETPTGWVQLNHESNRTHDLFDEDPAGAPNAMRTLLQDVEHEIFNRCS